MAFDWLQFLELAKELAARDDEASARSAISRAYYAAYHWARDYVAQELAVTVPKSEAHQAVWDALTQHGRKREELSAGAGGKRARVMRNQADYEARLPGGQTPREMALVAVKAAEAIIKSLDSLRS